MRERAALLKKMLPANVGDVVNTAHLQIENMTYQLELTRWLP